MLPNLGDVYMWTLVGGFFEGWCGGRGGENG